MAAGTRSSSNMWSSLRSISSRRRRISERLLAAAMNSPKEEAPAFGAGGEPSRGKLAEQIEVEFGPFRPAASRRAECFLVARALVLGLVHLRQRFAC